MTTPIEKYGPQHMYCPQCGEANVATTCIGYLCIDDKHIDSNKATCNNCGYNGIVHCLVNKETSDLLKEKYKER